MTVLTLNLALPSEFVSDAATAGTVDDWLVIQKSGQSQLRRLPASVTALGGALENGSLTENFSAALFYLPESGSLWATTTTANTTGLTVNGTTNVITAWCERLRVMNNLSSQDYAPIRCGGLEVYNSSEVVTASISSAGAIAGVSVAATGALSGATLTTTGLASCGGLTTGANAATVGSLQFNGETDCYIRIVGTNLVGYHAGSSLTMQTSNTQVVTKDVVPFTDNDYRLGGSGKRWIDVWAVNGTIQTSDERNKIDITDCDLGMEFISALRPVRSRWNDKLISSEIDPETKERIVKRGPGVRYHYGLLAQQVKQVLQGRDFAGYIYSEESDVYGLRYHEFIAPIIKALQEEHAARLSLEDRVAQLEILLTGKIKT